MDFHNLSRKELQTLCKKNKIPANITNVAMADALSALPQVEGLDEFLNPTEAETGAGTPETTHRTACRTATRKKVLREEPQSSKVVSSQRPQRKTRGGNGEEGGVAEQENKDSNVVPITPAARRRATAVSTRRSKKEADVVEDDEEKKVDHVKPADVNETPAAVPRSRTRVAPKTNGTSVQGGYNTRRSVRLLEKNFSKMSFMDAEDTGLGKNDDVYEEKSVSQQIEDSADTEEEVCDAGVSLQTVSNVVLEETDEVEVSSLEKSESECQVVSDVVAEVDAEPQEEDSSLEYEGSSEQHEVSNEVKDVSDVKMNNSIEVEAAPVDNEAGSELVSESVEESEDVSVEFAEQDVAALTVEVADDAPVEVTDQDDATGSLPMSPVSGDLVHEVDGKNNEAEILDMADDTNVQHFEPMNDVDDKAEDEKDLASPEDGVLHLGSSDICPSCEHQVEESEVKDESLAKVEEMDSASDVMGESSAIASEKDNANAISEDSIDAVESSADKSNNVENITPESSFLENIQEELEAKSEIESASSEKSVGVMEVFTESHADVTNATLEASLMDVGAEEEAEEKKDNLEAEGDAFSAETVTIAPIHEPKDSVMPVQSVVAEQSSMKENLTNDELHKKSIRELKMMLKKLSLQDKSNCKSKTIDNNNSVVKKEVERKRTALQALPENQMTN